MINRMEETEKEMVRKWKHAFVAATLAGDKTEARHYLDTLYDWLMYRGVSVLSDKEFEEFRIFVHMNDYL